MTGPSVEELNRVNDPEERRSRGAIRRFAVKVTSRVLWQLVGYKIDALLETLPAEPFTGIGVYARPPRDGKPEAIAVFMAGATSPAVVATRDEKTRARMAGDLAEGDTAIYSGTAIIVVRQSGTVEIRLENGVAVPLATLADLQAHVAWATTHAHPVATTGTAAAQTGTAAASTPAPPTPSGTSVLRGQ